MSQHPYGPLEALMMCVYTDNSFASWLHQAGGASLVDALIPHKERPPPSQTEVGRAGVLCRPSPRG